MGGYFSCVLGELGQVKCWGYNSYGQLGMGTTDTWGDSLYETFDKLLFLKLGRKAVKIRASFDNACAILDNGSFKCWGYNRNGQLGLGHTDNIGDDETLDTIQEISLGSFSC